MKLAVSSYSFSGALRDGRMTLMDVIPKAKEFGFEGVEITEQQLSIEEMRAMAQKLREQSKEYGIPIVSYLVGADFLRNDVDEEVKRLHKHVEIAALLGAPLMRHDAARGVDADGKPVDFWYALPRIAEGYRKVTEFAAGFGIHTMIENHGYYAQDSDRVKAIVDTVKHPNFGWLVDIGNFLCADEEPMHAVAVGAPYAVHAHVKDFHVRTKAQGKPNAGWFDTRGGNFLRGAVAGHGQVDIKGCLQLLKNAGYDKWLSLEFEGVEDCLMAIPEGRANILTALGGLD